MQQPWLEMKRTGFLEALRSLKPAPRVRSSPERQLQIGFGNGFAVFAVEGASTSVAANGDWPGLASVRLAHFLAFLIAKPIDPVVRITFTDNKIFIEAARIHAEWTQLKTKSALQQLDRHRQTPAKENRFRFTCPNCNRKQGVAVESLSPSSLASEPVKALLKAAGYLNHGFGCLRCGSTWESQIV